MNPQSRTEVSTLLDTVIRPGYCIGCGACAGLEGSPMRMVTDPRMRYVAEPAPDADAASSQAPIVAVCPFSQLATNEDAIGSDRFARDCDYHNRIGYHHATHAGYVVEDAYRERGSSGGMGTWILAELLRVGKIDAAIHIHAVEPSPENPILFEYRVVHSACEVLEGAKSRYYPIEMSQVLQHVRRRPGRYAIVGLPCFLKALHLVAKEDALIRGRIRYYIGLVCGHLKSARFADMFAWQCGIAPGDLKAIDFRHKIPGRTAREYGMLFKGKRGGEAIETWKPRDEFYGFAWGWCLFKYNACDYCDDVLAETADLTVGDAWLPRYIADSEGTNVLVVRAPEILDVINRAVAEGRVYIEPLTPDEAAQSQDAGLRHRREGLAYRLYLKEQAGELHPPKRVAPGDTHLDERVKEIMALRIVLMNESHRAFQKAVETGRFEVFVEEMQPSISRYQKLYAERRGSDFRI